jgi:hypothetical protein
MMGRLPSQLPGLLSRRQSWPPVRLARLDGQERADPWSLEAHGFSTFEAVYGGQVHGSTADIPRTTDVPLGCFTGRLGSTTAVHRR